MAKIKKEKAIFLRDKPHCNIGTIGHVDHGKTTLTAAITKSLLGIGKTKFKNYGDIDFHPEERARGITINAAHVEYETEKRHYSHIDCPGHQDYIKNMIIGATHMEGVILVVSATDGVQVQTREHVILAKEIGIPYLIVFLNKVDAMKEPSMLDIIELEVLELISNYGFSDNSPVFRGSAKKALEGNTNEINNIKKMYDSNGFLLYAPGPSSGKTSTIKIPPAQNNFTLECDKYANCDKFYTSEYESLQSEEIKVTKKNKFCLEQVKQSLGHILQILITLN